MTKIKCNFVTFLFKHEIIIIHLMQIKNAVLQKAVNVWLGIPLIIIIHD